MNPAFARLLATAAVAVLILVLLALRWRRTRAWHWIAMAAAVVCFMAGRICDYAGETYFMRFSREQEFLTDVPRPLYALAALNGAAGAAGFAWQWFRSSPAAIDQVRRLRDSPGRTAVAGATLVSLVMAAGPAALAILPGEPLYPIFLWLFCNVLVDATAPAFSESRLVTGGLSWAANLVLYLACVTPCLLARGSRPGRRVWAVGIVTAVFVLLLTVPPSQPLGL